MENCNLTAGTSLPAICCIEGVECYEKNGTVFLKLEAVARGLGFTDIKDGAEYVRWARVDKYLAELNFATSGERPSFIPENIFYRLAMKARNEAAERFQAKIADEVIPAIRRTGSYTVRPMSTAQMLLAQAQWNVEQESRLAAIEAKSEAMTEKLEKAVTVFALPTVEIEAWRGEMNKHISTLCETYELNYCKFRGETYQELEKIAGVNLSSRQTRMKSRMRKAGAKYADCAAVSKLHVIAQDKRLRPIYEGIIRREEARLLVCKAPA